MLGIRSRSLLQIVSESNWITFPGRLAMFSFRCCGSLSSFVLRRRAIVCLRPTIRDVEKEEGIKI